MVNSPFDWTRSNSGVESTFYRGIKIEKTPDGRFSVNGRKVDTENSAVKEINSKLPRW